MTVGGVAIGFSRTSNLLSRGIRLVTREEVSHAWILHEAYGGLFVMEAEWRGFRVVSWDHFRGHNEVVKVVPVLDRLATKGIDARERVNAAAAWLGDAYDLKSFFAFVLPALAGFQSPRKLLCSEAVVRAFPELFPGIDPERASPGQLMHALA